VHSSKVSMVDKEALCPPLYIKSIMDWGGFCSTVS
jgi:hypothetical protein